MKQNTQRTRFSVGIMFFSDIPSRFVRACRSFQCWVVGKHARCAQLANIVDFLAVVPSLFQLFISTSSNSTVIRTLRIFRVLRILKLSRSNDTTVKVMFSALSAAMQSLFVFGLCGVIVVVLFGSVQYTLENGKYMVTTEYPYGMLAVIACPVVLRGC
jgi:hypothetical protein